MTGWKRPGGFTVIELVLGMAAASVLAVTMSMMLFFAYTTWSRNSRALEMQRDATLSMQTMAKSLRQASATGVDVSQVSRLVVSNQGTATLTSFYQQGSDLFCNPALNSGGTPYRLVQGRLIPLGFTHSNITQGVTLRLRLQDGAETLEMNNSICFRN